MKRSSFDTVSTTPSPNTHLNLYLLQPTPSLGLPKDSLETASSSSLLCSSQFGKAASSIPLSLNSTISPASTSSFHRSKGRYFFNRQRRLLMQPPPSNPTSEDEVVTPRHLFCTVLDRNLNVKWIESRYTQVARFCNLKEVTWHYFPPFICVNSFYSWI